MSWLLSSKPAQACTEWTPVEKKEVRDIVRRHVMASIPPRMLTLGKTKVPNLTKGRGKGKRISPVQPKWRREPGWRGITAGGVADYGVKAWQLAKHLATLINVENKTWDVDGSSGTVITSTPTVVNLSNIAQGNDYGNRNGDSILCQSLEFRAQAYSDTAAAHHRVRVLIVSDKLQRGADPTLGDVLQGGTDPTVQPYLEPQEGRFVVLYDEVFVLQSPGPGLAASGTSTTYTRAAMNLPSMLRKWNQHIKYQGTSGADASNWVNGLYLMAVSQDASAGPTLKYTFRIRFTDN